MTDLPIMREDRCYRAGYVARIQGRPVSDAPGFMATTIDDRESWLLGWHSADSIGLAEDAYASYGELLIRE